MKPNVLITSVLLVATVWAAPASARVRYGYRASVGVAVPPPSGLYAGLSLGGTKIINQTGGPELLEDGYGGSLYGGIHLSDRVSLELGVMSSFHNPALVNTYYGTDVDHLVLDGVTLDAKVNFDRGGKLVPFVQGGLGAYMLSSEYFGTDSVGTGFQVGGGFDLWLDGYWSLLVRGMYRGVSMGPPDSTVDDTFISGLTVDVGITFNF